MPGFAAPGASLLEPQHVVERLPAADQPPAARRRPALRAAADGACSSTPSPRRRRRRRAPPPGRRPRPAAARGRARRCRVLSQTGPTMSAVIGCAGARPAPARCGGTRRTAPAASARSCRRRARRTGGAPSNCLMSTTRATSVPAGPTIARPGSTTTGQAGRPHQADERARRTPSRRSPARRRRRCRARRRSRRARSGTPSARSARRRGRPPRRPRAAAARAW